MTTNVRLRHHLPHCDNFASGERRPKTRPPCRVFYCPNFTVLLRAALCPLTPGLLFGTPMTDVSKLADSTAFKVVMPVLQNVLSAAAIGAFVYVVGALGTLQTTLNSYQTSQALLAARVDSLERSRDTGDKFIDSLRISDQKQDFKIDSITEVLKTIGRPK